MSIQRRKRRAGQVPGRLIGVEMVELYSVHNATALVRDQVCQSRARLRPQPITWMRVFLTARVWWLVLPENYAEESKAFDRVTDSWTPLVHRIRSVKASCNTPNWCRNQVQVRFYFALTELLTRQASGRSLSEPESLWILLNRSLPWIVRA